MRQQLLDPHGPDPARDHLALYDAQGRKQPKSPFGFIEVVRRLPWLLAPFDKEVPGEFFQIEEGHAVVACPCGIEEPPRVPFNVVTQCEGTDCGRWFFWDGGKVRVAREQAAGNEPETAVVD